jgi:predicted permease
MGSELRRFDGLAIGERQMSQLGSDLAHAARTLSRSPGFTLTAVLMLGLAMGALATLFSVVNTVLLQPLPFASNEQLYAVSGEAPESQFPGDIGVASELLVHYRERSQLIESAATYASFTNSLRADDRVERIEMAMVSTDLFATLGVAPVLGRLPSEADTQLVAVLSDRLWTDWFGRDPSIIGRSVRVFGEPREVIGVMPADFRFPIEDTLLWMVRPVTATSIQQLSRFGDNMVVRAKPGVRADDLRTELTQLAAQVPERFGGTPAYASLMQSYRALVQPLQERLLGPVSRPLWLLFVAAALLLLIACANLANLLLVRAQLRHRELVVRSALGAGRAQLMRLQLAETLLLSVMAATAAVVASMLLLPLLVSFAPSGVPRLDRAAIDLSTLAFTAAVAVVAGLICGLLPALRGAAPDLEGLREGGRGHVGRQHRVRHALVVAQTALALMLLIGAGLLLRSAHLLHEVDPGYEVEDVFTFQFAPEQASLSDPAAWSRFHQDFLERLRGLPGVESVGLVENVPLNEGTSQQRARTPEMSAPASEGAVINVTYSAGDYFRSMGIALLAGRDFDSRDHAGSGSIVVSESAARRLWPGLDPIGRRLQREGRDEWETVVGVVEDVLQSNFWTAAEPLIYAPLMGPNPANSWRVSSPAYVVKSARADSMAADVRALIRQVAPEAPMYRIFTLQGLVDDSLSRLTFTLMTLGLAALLAMSLGAIGLYGVLSYVVSDRSREIGLRMALGAPAAQVRRMVVGQGLRMVVLGLAVGLIVAMLGSRALGTLLFGVRPIDAATFVGMTLLMLGVGVLSSYLPARRASMLDPMESLRRD